MMRSWTLTAAAAAGLLAPVTAAAQNSSLVLPPPPEGIAPRYGVTPRAPAVPFEAPPPVYGQGGTNWLGMAWTNLHWPSQHYNFSYGRGPNTMRVFYPQDPARGSSYFVTAVGDGFYITHLGPSPAHRHDAAVLDMRVPYESEVWVQGLNTTQTGLIRKFVSPPLPVGEKFTYEVRVRWTENDKPFDRTRKVTVSAGDRITLVFPAPEEKPVAK